MPPCLTCPNPTRPSPGALYCPACHAAHRARNKWVFFESDEYLPPRPWPTADADWTTGTPNATCPACQGRYHYGAPGPFTHMCPLCGVWLKWVDTDEIVTKRRTVRQCSRCGADGVRRWGKNGWFYGCTNWGKSKCRGPVVKRVEEYEGPRLVLARWEAYRWTAMDENAEAAAVRDERIEGFQKWLDSLRWKRAKVTR